MLGYVLGISGSTGSAGTSVAAGAAAGPSTTVPGLTEAPATTIVPDGAESPGRTPSTTTTTTLAPESPAILRDVVPALSGRRLFGLGDGKAFIWRNGSARPQTFDVPMDAYIRWNEQGTHLAYIQHPAVRDLHRATLWISHQGQPAKPVWVGASTFAWHPSEPGIAWIGLTPGSETWQLMWADVTPSGLGEISVLDLGIVSETEFGWVWLAGFGDFGWVINHDQWEDERYSNELLAITPDLEVATYEGIDVWVVTVSPDGRILLGGSGHDHEQVWTDMAFVEGERIREGSIYDVEWAADAGAMLAIREDAASGHVVLTPGDDVRDVRLLPIPMRAYSPSIAPDASLVVAVVDQGAFTTDVSVVETETDAVVSLEIPGSWWFVDVAGA